MSEQVLDNLLQAMEMLCPSCGWRLLEPANKLKPDQPITWQCPDRKGCQAKLVPVANGQVYELRGAKAPVGIELAGRRHSLAEWSDLRWSLHEEAELPSVDPAGRASPLARARLFEAFALKRDHVSELFITPRELFVIRLGGSLALMLHLDPTAWSASTGNTLQDLLMITVGDRTRAELERNLQLLSERSLEEMLAAHAYNSRLPFDQIHRIELPASEAAMHAPEVGQMRLVMDKTRRTFRFPSHRDLLTASYLLVEQLPDKVEVQFAYDARRGKLVRRKKLPRG